ncbi:glycosyltransferase [bacterium]|nr:glycosyltransferase [bacterium]
MLKYCTIAVHKNENGYCVVKHIIFTVTNDLTYDQRMHRICNSLGRAGYHCTLVGRRLPQSQALSHQLFQTKRLRCFYNKGKLFYLEYNLRLFIYLLFRTEFHAVCAIDLDTLLPATLVAFIKRKKLGYDAHEYFTEVPEVVNRKLVKRVWHTVAKWCIPKTDFRYTVGHKLAEVFEQVYGKPFDVVRNVPVYRPFSKVEKQEKYLLYQGALNEGRGLEQLILAAPKLGMKVLFAGEGDLSDSLREMAAQSHAENIHFLGFVKPDELKEITAKAFLGYNLLENKGLSYYYSLANKFFDYAMAGVPCLISPFPEYESLNSIYKMAVPCELTAQGIVESVKALVADENNYTQLSNNCLAAAKELNWDKEEKELLKIYESVFK